MNKWSLKMNSLNFSEKENKLLKQHRTRRVGIKNPFINLKQTETKDSLFFYLGLNFNRNGRIQVGFEKYFPSSFLTKLGNKILEGGSFLRSEFFFRVSSNEIECFYGDI